MNSTIVEAFLKNQGLPDFLQAFKTPSRCDHVETALNSNTRRLPQSTLLGSHCVTSSTKASDDLLQTPRDSDHHPDIPCFESEETGKGGFSIEKQSSIVNLLSNSKKIAKNLQGFQVKCRSYGPWDEKEDKIIAKLVQEHGYSWKKISNLIGGTRSGKQIRERYLNKLDPNVASEPWTEEEDKQLLSLFNEFGRKWSRIAKLMPGRSEVMVKNRFYHKYKHMVTWRKKDPQVQNNTELKNWQFKRRVVSQRVNQIMQIMNTYRLQKTGEARDTSLNPNKKLNEVSDLCNNSDESSDLSKQKFQKMPNRFPSENSQRSSRFNNQSPVLGPSGRQELAPKQKNRALRAEKQAARIKTSQNLPLYIKEEPTEEPVQSRNRMDLEEPDEKICDSSVRNLKIEEDLQCQPTFFQGSGLITPSQEVCKGISLPFTKPGPSIPVEECKKRIDSLRSNLPKLELLYAQSLQELLLHLSSCVTNPAMGPALIKREETH